MAVPPNPNPEPKKNNRRPLMIAIAIFLIIGIAWFAYYLIWGRFYEWTDDAYVNGNQVMLTPQTPGIASVLYADNTYLVAKGQLLVELDRTDPTIALESAKANLASTIRQVVQYFANVKEYEATIEMREAELYYATQEYDHRQLLVDSGGVSLEDYQLSETKLLSARAALAVAEYQWEAALVLVENTTVYDHPLVEAAKDRVRSAWVALERTKLIAPVTGLVAQRSVQVGQWVKPGEPLLAVVPLDQVWVDANFKEDQLKDVRIGQPAEVTCDLYGHGLKFHGKVIGIPGGTGSIFSVLPPQNATGNWIKIVQRLPVRIGLDPEEVKQHPLRLGLSMEVKIDIHDTQLPMVPPVKSEEPMYLTDVFSTQESGAEPMIEEIMEQNINSEWIEDPVFMSGDE